MIKILLECAKLDEVYYIKQDEDEDEEEIPTPFEVLYLLKSIKYSNKAEC